MTESLGAILRNKEQAAATFAITQQQEQAAREKAIALKNAEDVARYFEELKVTVSNHLTQHGCAPTVEHGRDDSNEDISQLLGLNHFFSKDTCMDPTHAAHSAWKGFQAWALSQELAVDWRSYHSKKENDAGYPEEHWWYLEVKPA